MEYVGTRPKARIYGVFENIHKRGINFVNAYFNSNLKLFNNIENMLREELKKIVLDCKNKYTFSADLN